MSHFHAVNVQTKNLVCDNNIDDNIGDIVITFELKVRLTTTPCSGIFPERVLEV